MLTFDQQRLWEGYLHLERRGTRADREAALTAFVEGIRGSPQGEWVGWAQDLVRRIIDGREDVPVRLQLFEHVLFPALQAGRRNGRVDCTRWLCHFHHLLIRRPNCLLQLPPDERTMSGLLRAFLRVDPSNRPARQSLIKKHAEGFDYVLHEVPASVLFRGDGATEAECGLLLADLEEFSQLIAAEGAGDAYGALVWRCRLHLNAYPRYLRMKHQYAGYEAYLAEHHPDWQQYE
jgi:hypothetical protein